MKHFKPRKCPPFPQESLCEVFLCTGVCGHERGAAEIAQRELLTGRQHSRARQDPDPTEDESGRAGAGVAGQGTGKEILKGLQWIDGYPLSWDQCG